MYKPYTKGTSLELRRAVEKLLDEAGAEGMSTPAIAQALGGIAIKSTLRHLRNMLEAHRLANTARCNAYRWYALQHKPEPEPIEEPPAQTMGLGAPDEDGCMHQRTVAANDWRIDHPTSPASVFELGHHINRSAA